MIIPQEDNNGPGTKPQRVDLHGDILMSDGTEPLSATQPAKLRVWNVVGGDGAKDMFMTKLYHVLNDSRFHEVCRWSDDGTEFTILNQDEFVRTAMPAVCDFPDIDTFIYQLYMYDVGQIGRVPRAARGSEPSKLPLVFNHLGSRAPSSEIFQNMGSFSAVPGPVAASPDPRSSRNPFPTPLDNDVGKQIVFDPSHAFDRSGAFCDVFQGTHQTEGLVALKCLRNQDDIDMKAMVRQFNNEKDFWMGLRHDRILPCLGMFMRDDQLYLVSPYMKNGSLLRWLRRHESDVGLERLRMIHELADALAYLHSLRIVHGDVKAGNVVLSDDMHVQLCDFGLTKLSESATATAVKGAGSVRWQSPELLDDEPKSFESDVYAFAMTIVEVLTGAVPFVEMRNNAVLKAVLRGDRPVQSVKRSGDGRSYSNAWFVAEQCWQENGSQRISMRKAVELFSLCMECY